MSDEVSNFERGPSFTFQFKEATDEQRLRAIRERCDSATPGKWAVGDYGNNVETRHPEHQQCSISFVGKHNGIANTDDGEYIGGAWAKANAEFIANARTDIPFLLDLVEKQTREILLLREYMLPIDLAEIEKVLK